MKLLKEYIEKNGKAIGTNILKVDSFLNHQIDPNLMMAMGEEFKRRFEDQGINKILTIEASGIAIGLAAAYAFNVPLVFAKKKIPSTMGDFYTANVFSFTKNKDYTICVAKEFLKPTDRVLIVDDFLAMGNAVLGLKSLVESAGAEVIGAGIAVEKGFQQGEKLLIDNGVKVEALAVVDSLENGVIKFR
ncbi:xanthine phosphoribosyltransferase [Fusobacterium ulcerans]|uniref:Xanthine phosphoribosyltransferase n=1 Tax=Fusobacterium ulcerans 12-1B TaxID=457404 RepID=H1PTA8_9FUSO|nr:xanthine phosphoribosyltransferase [Fusobacterium ulcerans]EHO81285.1 xanthine phosphoribosyltransferase [Fusobacterium ulcerans 12-1B]